MADTPTSLQQLKRLYVSLSGTVESALIEISEALGPEGLKNDYDKVLRRRIESLGTHLWAGNMAAAANSAAHTAGGLTAQLSLYPGNDKVRGILTRMQESMSNYAALCMGKDVLELQEPSHSL